VEEVIEIEKISTSLGILVIIGCIIGSFKTRGPTAIEGILLSIFLVILLVAISTTKSP